MRLLTALPLMALVGKAIGNEMFSAEDSMRYQQASSVSDKEVNKLDLYANYAASAPCNIQTPPGKLVTCAQNCKRVLADGAVVLKTFLGETTEFGAYLGVIPSRSQIIFAGRGASTLKNWETCIDFILIPNNLVAKGMVHRGFQTAWEEIAKDVLGAIKDALIDFPGYDIVFAGESMGGAVATLGAANIRAAGYKVDLYTFGSPRVGNKVLVDFITKQPGARYRVTHNEDPVPRLPPRKLFPAYGHISPEYWLTGSPANPDRWPVKNIKVCPGNANNKCNANINNGQNMTDHTHYLGSLECWKPGSAHLYGVSSIPPGITEVIIALAAIDALPS